jgi:hypothetical protein
MPDKKKGPTNEEIFLKAATTNLAFRNALKDKNRQKISEEFDSLGIKVDNKEAVLDAILKVDWSELKHLERLLHHGLEPMMN